MIIERIWLQKIDDVKPIYLSSLDVLDSKVVPLGVTSSIVIWLED